VDEWSGGRLLPHLVEVAQDSHPIPPGVLKVHRSLSILGDEQRETLVKPPVELQHSVKSFLFIGHLILCISLVGQCRNLNFSSSWISNLIIYY